jgi:hypothetical protein
LPRIELEAIEAHQQVEQPAHLRVCARARVQPHQQAVLAGARKQRRALAHARQQRRSRLGVARNVEAAVGRHEQLALARVRQLPVGAADRAASAACVAACASVVARRRAVDFGVAARRSGSARFRAARPSIAGSLQSRANVANSSVVHCARCRCPHVSSRAGAQHGVAYAAAMSARSASASDGETGDAIRTPSNRRSSAPSQLVGAVS